MGTGVQKSLIDRAVRELLQPVHPKALFEQVGGSGGRKQLIYICKFMSSYSIFLLQPPSHHHFHPAPVIACDCRRPRWAQRKWARADGGGGSSMEAPRAPSAGPVFWAQPSAHRGGLRGREILSACRNNPCFAFAAETGVTDLMLFIDRTIMQLRSYR